MVKKTLRICITVYTQYRRVTDRQTDRRRDGRTRGRTYIWPRHSPRYAYMRRAVKIDARNNMGDYNMSTKLKEKLDEMEEIKK